MSRTRIPRRLEKKKKLNDVESLMKHEQQMDNLPQGSSFDDEGYRGYFNSSVQQWSNLLYSPTANDCEDLFLNSTRQLPNSHHVGWLIVKRHLFVPTLELPVNLNSPVEENSNRRHCVTKKMYFTFQQKKLLKMWIGCSRFIFNWVVSRYQRDGWLYSHISYRKSSTSHLR